MSATKDGSVVLEVSVVPRASRSKVVGEHDGRLKIQLDAPPVDGAANEALVELLAERLSLRRSAIELVRGQTSRKKQLRIQAASAAAVRAALLR
ncbi:MAG: YggU family protein [Deltaproteobacteria bacterium]|nr:YggU family protein [Deltaproteobacteria bacterium]